MAILDPALEVAGSDVDTGAFKAKKSFLTSSQEITRSVWALSANSVLTVANESTAFGTVALAASAVVGANEITVNVALCTPTAAKPIAVLAVDASVTDACITISDSLAFASAAVTASELVVSGLLSTSRSAVMQAQQAVSELVFYLRGYNPTTEQFEYWSSVGVANVSGVAHLQAVVIVGVV